MSQCSKGALCQIFCSGVLGTHAILRIFRLPLQSISDSCRHLTELQWSKKDSGPPEIADEINYKCGDAATPQELQGTYFPNQQAAELLSLLLEPLVVSVLCMLTQNMGGAYTELL